MSMANKLEAMLAGGQDTPLLRFSLGNEYLKTGDWSRAAEHLRAAVARDPAYSAAWKLLGKALAGAGDTDAARAAYEQGIRVATEKGDLQAAREMEVFLKRLGK